MFKFIKKIIKVHISLINSGDSIICKDGIERTVCNRYLKRGGFMGTSIFGDSYMSGRELVPKIHYVKVKV